MDKKPSAAPYPLFLDLRGIQVLVVGGGPVALRKVRGLRPSGARITVVSKSFVPGFARLNGLRRVRRPFRMGDLAGARLVFAASGDAVLNQRIAAAARRRGAWVNVVAPPEAGNLIVPAQVRRGKLSVAISTGGVSAAAARALRKDLSKHLDGAWTAFLALLETRRKQIKRSISSARLRRRLLQRLGDTRWVAEIRRYGARVTGAKMNRLMRQFGSKGGARRS